MSQEYLSNSNSYSSDTEENLYGETRFNAGGMFNYNESQIKSNQKINSSDSFKINGENLTPKILCELGKNENITISVNKTKIKKARDYIDKRLETITRYDIIS